MFFHACTSIVHGVYASKKACAYKQTCTVFKLRNTSNWNTQIKILNVFEIKNFDSNYLIQRLTCIGWVNHFSNTLLSFSASLILTWIIYNLFQYLHFSILQQRNFDKEWGYKNNWTQDLKVLVTVKFIISGIKITPSLKVFKKTRTH